MQMLNGAVLIVAATVALAGGIVGTGLMRAANRDPGGMPTFGIFVAFILGLIGSLLMVAGARTVSVEQITMERPPVDQLVQGADRK